MSFSLTQPNLDIVARLDVKALPYVIFLIVPVLGRMSDSDDDIRSISTNTFASLVKMVPLEVSLALFTSHLLTHLQLGLPDPEGFPPELMDRRDQERGFLAQLLDGSKVEHYPIPVEIKADLRKYQVDGVNWLAFLAKYQLHGVLCDGQLRWHLLLFHFIRFCRYGPRKNSPVNLYPSQ
jgi:TATA-binding protein-associated factor